MSNWCAELLSATAAQQGINAQWQDLSRNARNPNAFFEPCFLLPALQHLASKPVHLLCIWNSPDKNQLLLLLPLVKHSRYFSVPMSHTSVWRHPYCFLCTPLVSQEVDDTLLLNMLEHATRQFKLPGCLTLSWLGQHACFVDASQPLLPQHWRAFRDVPPSNRAGLYVNGNFTDYLATLRTKKKKDLFRSRRRLGEQGEYQVEIVDGRSDPDLQQSVLDEFLGLENQGWKQQQGSSLASDPAHEDYFRQSMQAGLAMNQVLLVRLRLDKQAAAMLVVLLSACGRAGYTFKIAINTQLERYSPGSLAILELTEHACSGKLTLDYLDSCAAPEHPMINSLWRDRLNIHTVALVKKTDWRNPVIAMVAAGRRLKHKIQSR